MGFQNGNMGLIIWGFYVLCMYANIAEAAVKMFNFDVKVTDVIRLCHAKPMVTVNGLFAGPTVYARDGDTVLNMSIHWHGLKQFRNGWADGPAYITGVQ